MDLNEGEHLAFKHTLDLIEDVVEGSPHIANLHIDGVGGSLPIDVVKCTNSDTSIVLHQLRINLVYLWVGLKHDTVKNEGAIDVFIEITLIEISVIAYILVEHS